MTTHSIKTWMPFYQDILDGKKPFEFRKNDRNYSVGDEVVMHEYDDQLEEFSGRQLYCTITYLLVGPNFGIPEGYCVFGFHTNQQGDFLRDYDKITNMVLPHYEEKLSHRMSGDLMERMNHVLGQYDSIASSSVLRAKQFVEDVKTQFKALEIVVEGITGHGNHTEKRVIANHVITMLRQMIDKIDRIDWEYSTQIFERYNYFRSHSPERSLMEKYRDMKYEPESLKQQLQQKNNGGEDLPF